jgi:hypothetical protein
MIEQRRLYASQRYIDEEARRRRVNEMIEQQKVDDIQHRLDTLDTHLSHERFDRLMNGQLPY